MATVIDAQLARAATRDAAEQTGSNRAGWRMRSLGGMIGLILVSLLVIAALAGPWLTTIDPAKQNLIDRLQPPVGFGGTWTHPLGTDPHDRTVRIAPSFPDFATVGIAAEGVALSTLLVTSAALLRSRDIDAAARA